jgi:hypothetical protein
MLLGFAAVPVAADEVLLIDGVRLTGRVAHKAGDKLTLTTFYAGDIELEWDQVKTLATDGPVDVLLVGADEPLRAPLELAGEGGVRLRGVRFALIDVVYINPTPDEAGSAILYSGNAKASATITRGNSRGEQTYFESDMTARSANYRYTLLGKINSGRDDGVKTAGNWLASGNFDRFIDDREFLYVRGSLERDRFRDIERRSTTGVGYGLQLVETQRSNVSVRGGIDFVKTDLISVEDERYPAFGWGIHAAHKIAGRFELLHDQDGFWYLEDGDSVTIR